ncbi:hypothetical protein SAMN02745146_3220 [Hymenobacter daecheongensis DSM 21074]|uniref:Uncharacterized protein n=1 Tax=Hymenobacter daecheongensis DSM 21074 TaxID=1121955 RepID=A0A1M6JPT2_9BACT|nr:hypothetical protein SAMN02745146_3220 [Hymenobacter daecheongensis DSM 21074]
MRYLRHQNINSLFYHLSISLFQYLTISLSRRETLGLFLMYMLWPSRPSLKPLENGSVYAG